MKKGRTVWVPPVVIEEVKDIMREDGIPVGAEAYRRLIKYARVGREVNRLRSIGYDWSKKRKLPPVDEPDLFAFSEKSKKKSLFLFEDL